MTRWATPLTRVLARHGALVAAQILEAFLRRKRYGHLVARADRFGLPLALLFKITGGRRDLVLVSVWLSRAKKALFLRLGTHSHLGAIITYGSVQRDAAVRLGVPAEKLAVLLQPVDEDFWRPVAPPADRRIVAVGAEARDYPTLIRALHGLDVEADLAVGSSVLPPSGDAEALFRPMLGEILDAATSLADVDSRLRIHHRLRHDELRELYARARVVVVPLHDVDFDAGVTTITEAMAMGRPVVVTRTRGQVDIVRDGETGLYVPPRDPQALRQAIQRLLDSPDEAERMGRAGRARVEASHTLDAWVSGVAHVVRRGSGAATG
jgi:glycosyltransferase involved in cell wall biosynthesis